MINATIQIIGTFSQTLLKIFRDLICILGVAQQVLLVHKNDFTAGAIVSRQQIVAVVQKMSQ